jgi:RNA-splicing ligase RtcB
MLFRRFRVEIHDHALRAEAWGEHIDVPRHPPGVPQAVYAMPDAHWCYGFPIGGMAPFDPDEGGVGSAGGVGFDISCGVRTLRTAWSTLRIPPALRTRWHVSNPWRASRADRLS